MQHLTGTNYSGKVIHGEYYPHIDGIRAFAVLPVVLFHVLAMLCPGGYAGVDVFFVISGYLITGGIRRDLAKDRFSIRDFYHRRIRRILPAYFAVVAGVFAFGCAVYYSLPLMRLADASVMGSLFVANQYLWNISGDYFSPNVHANPLMHLWSLSVEEQFYLFIPVICLVVLKFRRRGLMPLLVILAILSFGWSAYAMASGKQVMAFYVLPLRAWDLLAGAILAMVPTVPSCAKSSLGGNGGDAADIAASPPLLSGLGLLLIIVPYVLYTPATPFPGVAALPSVIGTALLIRYGAGGWVGGLLAWRPLVVIGKMSYSLYLWHWPVVVYWKYMVYDQLYVLDYLGMLLFSLFLGWLSWRFVEIPVRASPAWTRRRSFAFAAAGIVLLVGIGVTCVFNRGWSTQLHPKANEIIVANKPLFVESLIRAKVYRIRRALGCKTTSKEELFFSLRGWRDLDKAPIGNVGRSCDVLLIGDSHAGALRHGLDITLRERGLGGQSISYNGKIVFVLGSRECNDVLAELANHPQQSRVILVQHWNRYVNDVTLDASLEAFAAHVKAMRKTVFIVADIPTYPVSPAEQLAKERIIGPCRFALEHHPWQSDREYERQQGAINRRLEAVCRKTGAVLIPLQLALREGNRYVAIVEQNGSLGPLYLDENHLCESGSLRAARFLMPYLFPASGK